MLGAVDVLKIKYIFKCTSFNWAETYHSSSHNYSSFCNSLKIKCHTVSSNLEKSGINVELNIIGSEIWNFSINCYVKGVTVTSAVVKLSQQSLKAES